MPDLFTPARAPQSASRLRFTDAAPLGPALGVTYRWLAVGLAPVCAVLIPADAHATFGPYLRGDGIRSLGFGGIGLVAAEDTFPLAANPALAASLESRFDFGLDWERVIPVVSFRGNLLGPNDDYQSSFNNVPVPQFGYRTALSEHFSYGVTGFAAGFGMIYHHSPYQRLGGPEQASLLLGQSGITNAVAYEPVDGQAFGVSLNLSYQLIRARGLDPFKAFSEDPEHVTDQGIDGAAGVGFSLGWHGHLNEWLEAGVVYRSKTWSQRFDEYAGVLPDQGSFDLPARYGAAFALRPTPRITIAVEGLRILFAAEKATGNTLDQLFAGPRLGADDGPGFGWRNQNVIKLGLSWALSPVLSLRAGFNYGTGIIRRDQTLMSTLAPGTTRQGYSLGGTYTTRKAWEISGYVAVAPTRRLDGEDSVPLLVGGGEIDLRNRNEAVGLSIGRRFR